MKETKYMSKEYTNSLRGILAILVVIHHLYLYSGLFRGMFTGTIFQLLGVLCVAVFFFLSGYGLMLSSKRENYIDTFFSKRFLPLYCFYVFILVLYSIWTFLIEGEFSFKLFIQSLFFGNTIVTGGWYLQTTFVVYLIYFFIFKSFKRNKTRLFLFGICIFAYCVICHLTGMATYWYQTVPCVVLGMVFCCVKNCIDIKLKKHVWVMFALCSILFAICVVLSYKSGIPVIFNVLYLLFFACCIILVAYILADTPFIHNRFFALCGNYSLEIYATHGLFLRLIKLECFAQMPIYVHIILVLIGTILMSVVVKKIYIVIVSSLHKVYQ